MTSTSTCAICTESLETNKKIKLIKCFCDFEACMVCYETYILSKNEYAQCMDCHKIFDREFLVDNFSFNFVNKIYKTHKEQFISEKELTYLPIAQLELERVSRIEKYKGIIYELKRDAKYTNKLYLIYNEYQIITTKLKYANKKCNITFKSENDYKIDLNIYKNKLENELKIWVYDFIKTHLYEELNDQELDLYTNNLISGTKLVSILESRLVSILESRLQSIEDKKEIQVKKFIQKCPNNDCRGFLSENMYCELCGITACKRCREIKDTGKQSKKKSLVSHVCDPSILENINLLKKDSKNCPNCAAIIFRISGCLQMFCTQCHTAFNWKTLEIETGIIHNPHFFEYQRRLGLDNNNIREPHCRVLDNNFSMRFCATFDKVPLLTKKLVDILHIKEVELPSFRIPVQDPSIVNQDLHLRYLKNEINLDRFKVLCQQREKKHDKKDAFYKLLYMYTESMADIYFNLYDSCEPHKITHSTTDSDIEILVNNIKSYYSQMLVLDEYLLTHYTKLRRIYNSKIKNDYILNYLYLPENELYTLDIKFEYILIRNDRLRLFKEKEKIELRENLLDIFYSTKNDICHCCLCNHNKLQRRQRSVQKCVTCTQFEKDMFNLNVTIDDLQSQNYHLQCIRLIDTPKMQNKLHDLRNDKIIHDCLKCDLNNCCCLCNDKRSIIDSSTYCPTCKCKIIDLLAQN